MVFFRLGSLLLPCCCHLRHKSAFRQGHATHAGKINELIVVTGNQYAIVLKAQPLDQLYGLAARLGIQIGCRFVE